MKKVRIVLDEVEVEVDESIPSEKILELPNIEEVIWGNLQVVECEENMARYKVTMTYIQGEEYIIEAKSVEEAIEKVESGEGNLVKSKDIAREFSEIEKL